VGSGAAVMKSVVGEESRALVIVVDGGMKLPMRSRVVWIKRSAVSKPQFVVSGRREQQ